MWTVVKLPGMSRASEADDLAEELTIRDGEVHTGESREDLLEYIEDEKVLEDERQGYAFGPEEFGPIQWEGWDRSAGGRIDFRNFSVPYAEDYAEKKAEFGIDKVVFSPGPGFRIVLIPDQDTQVTYMRAMNRLTVDRFARPEENYYAKLYILGDHPEESAEEIRKHGDDDGIVGCFITDIGPTFPMGHRSYDPIYEAAEEHDLPIILHSTTGTTDAYPAGGMKPKNFLEFHSLAHTVSKMWHATSIIVRGVPERYDVDFGFWEGGISWVQTLATRLDRDYVERMNEAPDLTKLPSDYLSDFYYGSQPLEETREPEHLQRIIELNRLEDQIVFTTDFPHQDFDSTAAIIDHEGLTREQKRKILQDNGKELFGI